MSEEEKGTAQTNEKLLNEEQEIVLQNIARLGQGLSSQRAIALLALDGGSTRAEAGEKSGLSLGQTKYLLATFRHKGMGMFARYSFSETSSLVKDDEPEVIVKVADRTDKAVLTKKSKKKPKKKDAPKGKDKKMAKKGKKPKKDKKAKAKGKGKKKGKKKGGKKKGKK